MISVYLLLDYGVLGFYAYFYLLFATYLRQDKKVDNVGQNPTNLN